MADLFSVCDTIAKMADGFEARVMATVGAHPAEAVRAVQEQMYSGFMGDGSKIEPTYDNDPFFEQEFIDGDRNPWYHDNERYKRFKKKITPPESGAMLRLDPRSDHEPNIFITGKFHASLTASLNSDVFSIGSNDSDIGPDILSKYGDQLLHLGPEAVGWFKENILLPDIVKFFQECGW